MYKHASENLQRAARGAVTNNGVNAIDPLLLRETDEMEAVYAALAHDKRKLEFDISEVNRNLDLYKSSALRARFPIDNAHHRKLVAERSRLSKAIALISGEMLSMKATLKLQRKAVSAQRANVYDAFFKQAAKLILAEELYEKVCELAATLADSVEDRVRGER
jgi:hypothetical protein